MRTIAVLLLLTSSLFSQRLASTIGEQATIAVPVNYGDSPTPCGFTAAQLHQTIFGSDPIYNTDGFYRSATGNRVWFTGDTAECVTIPSSLAVSTGTSLPDISAAVEQVLVSRGYDMNKYNRRILALAYIPGRNGGIGSWGAGSTTAGGTQYSIAWLTCSPNPYNALAPVACSATNHELGHNFKFTHAASLTSERGDTTDIMGSCGTCGFNAPHWTKAGWSAPLDISTSGTYTLSPLNPSGNILRIAGTNYISYNLNKVNYYQWAGNDEVPYFIQTLGAAQIGGAYVAVLDQTPAGAVLSVQFGGTAPPPPPPPTLPVVSISPNSLIIVPKQQQQFIANQNVNWSLSSNCGSLSNFSGPTTVYKAPNGAKTVCTVILTARNSAGSTATAGIMVGR